jgi:hypothetical protein
MREGCVNGINLKSMNCWVGTKHLVFVYSSYNAHILFRNLQNSSWTCNQAAWPCPNTFPTMVLGQAFSIITWESALGECTPYLPPGDAVSSSGGLNPGSITITQVVNRRKENSDHKSVKKTNNDLQNTTKNTIDWVTRNPLKIGVNSSSPEAEAVINQLVSPVLGLYFFLHRETFWSSLI